ncbi:MAG: MATE family efflux transporter, partial [Dehalococcoidales bacterium]|nr:MATE family efflux transporter [Dehalococcoidales bacterium]
PPLGVKGAAIARAASSFIGASIVVTLLVKGRGPLKYDLKTAHQFDLEVFKRIFRIGFPAFLDAAQMRGAMSVYQIIISSLGTTVYAAHALTMRVEEFAFMPSFGFSVATTALVGQFLGAKRPDLAEKSAKTAAKYCVISMVVLGVVTFLFGGRLLALFISDPEVLKLGALGLRIWAFAMPGMAINNVLSGGLRGAGDTKWVLYLSTMGMWTVRVGGGALMVYVFQLGAPGAWAGAIADQTVRAFIIWLRFRTGRWKEIKI